MASSATVVFMSCVWKKVTRGLAGMTFWLLLGPVMLAGLSSPATDIYKTGFEASEGFDVNLDLDGQKGWIGVGSGGNGLVTGLIGPGQQAYVGFSAPLAGDQGIFLYHPLNQSVLTAHFEVKMALYDSSNTNWDNFYWAPFNSQGDQFFTLDFDNYDLRVYYLLDGATNDWVDTGRTFTNGAAFKLTVDLDFSQNRWSAHLDGAVLATNQLLTTVGVPLNLGDIDAAWAVYDPQYPGNNYMVFDDYTVSATVQPPSLQVLGTLGKSINLRLFGPATTFAIDGSTNLVDWLPLTTNITSNGYFDYVDTASPGLPNRYYRGRWTP